ncbi:MAG: response regulator [Dehalococcoidales bacterium]|nr:response regulator [Dehalococcoidales bacterium]
MDKKKILIADDETNIRSLLRDLLDSEYTILEANNGDEAIRMAQGQNPDLILMDIMMPKTDGYTACSIIKTDQTTNKIPIVMLSGIGYDLNKKLAREIGAEGYISKPFSLQDLRDTIDQFLKPAS